MSASFDKLIFVSLVDKSLSHINFVYLFLKSDLKERI